MNLVNPALSSWPLSPCRSSFSTSSRSACGACRFRRSCSGGRFSRRRSGGRSGSGCGTCFRCYCNWPFCAFWSLRWPIRSSAGSRPGRGGSCVVVDNSSSMNASRRRAHPAGRGQGPGTEVDRRHAAGRRAGVDRRGGAAAGRLRPDRSPAHAARRPSNRSTPSTGRPASIRPSRWLGRLLSGSEKIRKVVILSDGGFDGAADLARQDDVELIGVGKKTGNVGITRLQARRSLLDPIGYEILVEVCQRLGRACFGATRARPRDDPIDVVPLKLARGRKERPGLREDLGRWRPAPRHDRPGG